MENKAITRTVLLGVATLFVVVTASYIFATIQSDSPEQLVVGLQKAASSGEVEGFLSGLTRESRDIVEKSYADRVLLRQAQTEFQKALDEKFGNGTEFLPAAEDDLRSAISRIAATEVVSKKEAADGSVELKLRTTVKTDSDKTANIENTVAARKENGEWKLSLGFPEKRLNVARIKADIERITAEVRSGRYEDRVAAMIALDNAVRAKEVK
jgi:hypothetical protein